MACPEEIGADVWLATVQASGACVRQVVAKLRSAALEKTVPPISWIQSMRECLMEVTWGLEEGLAPHLDATTSCLRLVDLMRRYYDELEEGQVLCDVMEERCHDNDDLTHIAAVHNNNNNNDNSNEKNNNDDDNNDSGDCNSDIDSLEDGDDVRIEAFTSGGNNDENITDDDDNENNSNDDNNNNNNNTNDEDDENISDDDNNNNNNDDDTTTTNNNNRSTDDFHEAEFVDDEDDNHISRIRVQRAPPASLLISGGGSLLGRGSYGAWRYGIRVGGWYGSIEAVGRPFICPPVLSGGGRLDWHVRNPARMTVTLCIVTLFCPAFAMTDFLNSLVSCSEYPSFSQRCKGLLSGCGYDFD
ncbi:hypothetical protein CBR_g45257 [Chara braunii]|uniref:Uncharacterized protein n=1 Tax=Chara braunii TaxID=69332 RepID=A0A388K3P6_CHABU|nr:hypothetical protein CBR_g45257 [Chara braunii]|eukprot:GBG64563.1 hypothetical protein CBR_g45257 [Chara braunii]